MGHWGCSGGPLPIRSMITLVTPSFLEDSMISRLSFHVWNNPACPPHVNNLPVSLRGALRTEASSCKTKKQWTVLVSPVVSPAERLHFIL